MNIVTTLFRKAATTHKGLARKHELVRTFVETGDERCPLAGIWMRLTDNSSPADDPELLRPAVEVSLWRRAFHLGFTALQYSTT